MVFDWPEHPLEDCMEAIVDYRGKTPRKSAHGVPLITAKVIKNGALQTPTEFVAESDYASWMRRGLPRVGDVVLTTEAPLGEVAQLSAARVALAQRVILLRGRNGTLDNTFLKCLLRSPLMQQRLHARSSGSTVSGIKQSELRKVLIPLPPIKEQRAIASVLGALDDKIELNGKMSATLEAMARALFKSWFVDFDPVREKAERHDPGLPPEIAALFPDSFEESELGLIPSEWRVGTVEDLCSSVSSGGTPARMTSEYWVGGSIPWFKTGELNDGPLLDSSEHITDLAVSKSSCKLWQPGTILFALYAAPTVGRMGLLTRAGTSNQAAAGLTAYDQFGTPFLFQTLLIARRELQNVAVGAAQQNINLGVLKAHKVLLPSVDVAGLYSSLVTPLVGRQGEAVKESATLSALRDVLLPKLISGEIRVTDAERLVEQAV